MLLVMPFLSSLAERPVPRRSILILDHPKPFWRNREPPRGEARQNQDAECDWSLQQRLGPAVGDDECLPQRQFERRTDHETDQERYERKIELAQEPAEHAEADHQIGAEQSAAFEVGAD